jgi:bifunctional DNA-binding transcriptional regulator/antitoxin component of YhaV-PrlF toxin-antitoxin module
MTKQLKSREEFYLEFSDSEIAELGIKQGDKFTVSEREDGSILLTPYANIEINLDEFSHEALVHLISLSVERNETIEETLEHVLTEWVKDYQEFGF